MTQSDWMIHDWLAPMPTIKPLRASDIIRVVAGTKEEEPSVTGLIKHADISYLSCRILFLANYEVHPAALYMAAQTIEKYLKAILVSRGTVTKGYSHDLEALARDVGEPFTDREFLSVCTSLRPFEVAGRYDDGHPMEEWTYSLDLLSLLDAFVVRCRELIPMPRAAVNKVLRFFGHMSKQNDAMIGAEQAVKDNNTQLWRLLSPWDEG